MRSTKAGAETPATHAVPAPGSFPRLGTADAQRRPGPRPRRHNHLTHPIWTALNEGRGRDPGATRPLNEGRGRDPGDTYGAGCSMLGNPLNEGRGRDPGDTSKSDKEQSALPHGSAQRRPGPRPRRHDEGPAALDEGIGAQRRPGPRPRRHLRPHVRGAGLGSTSLNEGRGRDPGDTNLHGGGGRPRSAGIAQRRPGPRPRRHRLQVSGRDPRVDAPGARSAQRRPGPRPRRHDAEARVQSYRDWRRSTKAGAETPATLLIGAEQLGNRYADA